jgi:hypothetical protein
MKDAGFCWMLRSDFENILEAERAFFVPTQHPTILGDNITDDMTLSSNATGLGTTQYFSSRSEAVCPIC